MSPSLQNPWQYTSTISLSSHSKEDEIVPPQFEAIDWLEDALKHGENPEDLVSLALARIYGFCDRFDKMMEVIDTVSSSQRRDSQLPEQLMMLIYACRNLLQIQKLMDSLQLQLPTQAMVIKDISNSAQNYEIVVNWYVFQLDEFDNMEIESAIPIVVRIFFEYSGNDVLTHALAFKQGIQSLSLSVPEEGSPSEKKGLSIDELVKQLFNKFLLICPAPYFRER